MDETRADSTARPRLRFPKAARLRYAGEFRRVKDKGRAWSGRFMVLSVLTDAVKELEKGSDGGSSRIGFITSRRVGGAVIRNRVRRRLHEAVRPCRPRLRAGCWIVIIARNPAARASLAELNEEWLRLARRASILQAPPAPSP